MADAFELAYLERVRSTASLASGVWLGRERPAGPGALIAGWWCPPDANPPLIVLPNPWNDRAGIVPMEELCWRVTEAVISRLAPALDELHGTAGGVPYWHVMLAPLLVHVVSAVSDRRLFLRAAGAACPGAPVLGVDPVGVPATMGEAIRALRDPHWGASLMTDMATALGMEVRRPDDPWPVASRSAAPAYAHRTHRMVASLKTPREAARKAEWLVGTTVLRRALALKSGARVSVVGASGMTPRDGLRLARRVPGLRLPAIAPPPAVIPPLDAGLRARLPHPDLASEELERLVLALLPGFLPRSVLEGYNAVRAKSAQDYGHPTPVVACNYAADEVQNDFLGRCTLAGHRVVFAQHGGFYLQAAVNAQERLELRPGSEFWSWGGGSAGAVPTPTPRLERLRGRFRGGRSISLIEGLYPPDSYVLRFASTPLGNQTYDASERLAAMVEAATPPTRALMRLKRFPPVVGEAPRPRALDDLPSVGPGGAHSATDWMRESLITVVSYPDTPFIESLVLGGPTIGLWNPAHWEWREGLRELVDGLERAEIVFGDPVRAAAHLESVVPDVRGWWDRPDVVSARAAFVDRLAPEGDWCAAWTAGLRRISAP